VGRNRDAAHEDEIGARHMGRFLPGPTGGAGAVRGPGWVKRMTRRFTEEI
jgi:hypothetical protein